MNETVFKNALAFLNRVQLEGREVDAFNEVKQSITDYYKESVDKVGKAAEWVKEAMEDGKKG